MAGRRIAGIAVAGAALIGLAMYLATRPAPDTMVTKAPPALEKPKPKSVFASGPPLTDAERAAYGARADFFESLPAEVRPDPDWRSVLRPGLADAQVKWSQGNEELIVRDFFNDRKGGFYLDVGCSVPRVGSTTHTLAADFGWTGIGIDVQERFAPLWKEHRPNATFIAKAVSDADGETLTLYLDDIFASLDEETIDGLAGDLREVDVTTVTLNTVLEEHGVEKIDFLSMDIEGAEPAALRGFDIQRYKPDLCCVEASKDSEVTEFFEAHGYEIVEKYRPADKINLYFQPKSGN